MRAVFDVGFSLSTKEWSAVGMIGLGVILLILAVVVIERSFPKHWG
jgi:hypothetical protein